DAGLPADVLDRHAGVGLLEDRDDLGLGETGLLHGTSWLGKTCQKVLLMGCLRIGEAYATADALANALRLPQAWFHAETDAIAEAILVLSRLPKGKQFEALATLKSLA